MRDPHVGAIYYKVSSDKGISYCNPEAMSFSNHLGTFDLSDGLLRVVPTEHFPDEDQSRQAIEPFLRAWEIEADLDSNVGMIRFTFDRAQLIDRDPPPVGSPQVIVEKVTVRMNASATGTFHLTCRKYPEPPYTFRATPEVQHAYRRWLGYQDGKEPLQAMAYFVLTLLESMAGGRKKAAQTFSVDKNILNTMGRLTSTKGDPRTARKVTYGKQFDEMTAQEKRWLEVATRKIIRRLGEHASGAPAAIIDIKDLPSIGD